MAADHIVITVMACLATCAPTKVRVWDGDTLWVGRHKIRMADFDTPERGNRARCGREREKAEQARQRLAQILSSAERVEVGRPKGHSYDREVAELRVGGQLVGQMLMDEGLATRGMAKEGTWCRD